MSEFFRVLDAADDHPGIPWPCLAAFVPRVWENHRLTTTGLAERGVTACEAVAILEDRPVKVMNLDVALKRLDQIIEAWRASRCRMPWGRFHGRYQFDEEDKGRLGSNVGGSRAPDRARKASRNVGRRDRPSPTSW